VKTGNVRDEPAIEAGMTAKFDQATVKKAYARWAPVYDLVFGTILFDRGRQAAIAAAERIGGRVLEVGVGTGISLPGYSARSRIVGIDLSEPMLRKAQERVAELSLKNVESLEVMDAEHLSFPDASFDVVRRLGWRTAFPWSRFASWTNRRDDVELVERRAMPPFGHFSLLRFAKSANTAGS
jgi:phosphatidylethanolamine/phosphatidyl-N-methylethanolamine N-methyltransferase